MGRALRLGWPLILLLTVIAVAVSVFVTSRRSPEYEAGARLLITPLAQYDDTFLGTTLFRDAGDPTTTALTAAELFHSNAIADRAAGELGAGWTRESLLAAVEVRQVPDTRVLEVAARAEQPDEAARAANVFAQTIVDAREREAGGQLRARLSELRDRRQRVDPDDYSRRDNLDEEIRLIENALQNGGDPTLTMSQEAVAPTTSTLTPTWLIVGTAVLGGLVLGVLAAFGLAWATRRVQGEREVVSALGLPVLSRVPRIPRGLRGAPVAPHVLPAAGLDAFDALALRLQRQGAGRRVVVVTSAGRGDGRTTAVVNLGLSLVELGERVTILELDRDRDIVGQMLSEHPYPDALRLAATQAGRGDVDEQIARARDDADWIVIDAPPMTEDRLVIRAAELADEVLLAVRLGHSSRDDLRRMRDLLERSGAPVAGLLLLGVRRGEATPAPPRPRPSGRAAGRPAGVDGHASRARQPVIADEL